MKKFPSFSSLRAFEAAARLGSFKEAADALSLSTSAVSHQIRLLEVELGTPLFERRPGGVQITAQAQKYLRSVRNAFDQLEKGTEEIQSSEKYSELRVSLLSTLSTLWLIPRLKDFQALFPGNRIELIDDIDLVDFEVSRLDAAIRYDYKQRGEWNGLIAHPLHQEYIFPVCSPDYLKKHPEIVTLTWDSRHTILVNSRHPDEWKMWFKQTEESMSANDSCNYSVMDTSNMTLMAACNGLGIALGRTPFTDEMLACSRLVRINRNVQYRGIRHFLVYPPEHANKRNLLQFREWLVTSATVCNKQYEHSFSS